MAKRVRVKLDENGMGQMLAGSEVRAMVRASGDRIAASAGPGFEADTWVSPVRGRSKRGYSNPPRAVSGVFPETPAAYRRQMEDNVLQRARDAGRT